MTTATGISDTQTGTFVATRHDAYFGAERIKKFLDDTLVLPLAEVIFQ